MRDVEYDRNCVIVAGWKAYWLSVIANIPNNETARGVCIKALDFDRPHVPSGIYNNVSYRADFEGVPTTAGQMWFKLTAYGPN